jgi:Glutathione peroxidase
MLQVICGLTYQYEPPWDLYKKYKESGFLERAFPCNQFALQEPGTNEEIRNFCDTKYAITFEIFNKIHVKGSKSDPLYKFLKNKMPGVAGTSQIKGNFTKFLISKNGDIVKRFSPQTEANEIELSIMELL